MVQNYCLYFHEKANVELKENALDWALFSVLLLLLLFVFCLVLLFLVPRERHSMTYPARLHSETTPLYIDQLVYSQIL